MENLSSTAETYFNMSEKPAHNLSTMLTGYCTELACIPFVAIALIIGMVGMFANGLIIVSFCKFEDIRCQAHYAIVSFACLDFLTGLVGIPLHEISSNLVNVIPDLSHVTLSKHFCLVKTFFAGLMVYLKFLHQLFIATERYLKICHHFKCVTLITNKRLAIALVCVWLYGIAVSIIPLLAWHTWQTGYTGSGYVNNNNIVSYITFPHVLISVVAACGQYIGIYRHVKQQAKAMNEFKKKTVKPTHLGANTAPSKTHADQVRPNEKALEGNEKSSKAPELRAKNEESKAGSAQRSMANTPTRARYVKTPQLTQQKCFEIALNKREVQVAKSTAIAAGFIVFLSIPIFLIGALSKYKDDPVLVGIFYNLSIMIIGISSFTCPIIYVIFNIKLRRAILKLLKCSS